MFLAYSVALAFSNLLQVSVLAPQILQQGLEKVNPRMRFFLFIFNQLRVSGQEPARNFMIPSERLRVHRQEVPEASTLNL